MIYSRNLIKDSRCTTCSTNFVTTAKVLASNIYTIASIWHENMLGYLLADIICSEKRTVFWECTLRRTVSCDEQIMSKDKYASIFSPKMEAIVFVILQFFLQCTKFWKLGNILGYPPVLTGEYSVPWRV